MLSKNFANVEEKILFSKKKTAHYNINLFNFHVLKAFVYLFRNTLCDKTIDCEYHEDQKLNYKQYLSRLFQSILYDAFGDSSASTVLLQDFTDWLNRKGRNWSYSLLLLLPLFRR